MKHRIMLAGIATAICALPLAASGAVASGAVRDLDDVPVAGVRIVFTNEANLLGSYSDTTGLDGTYGIDLSSAPTALLAPRELGAPKRLQLLQNYPNPFNSTTVIAYGIAAEGRVNLDLYNILGQRIRTLIDQRQEPGQYRIEWDGRNDRGDGMAAGVYVYSLRSGNMEASGRMVMTDGAAARPNPGPGYAAPKPVLLGEDDQHLYTVTISGDKIESFSQTGIAVPEDRVLDFDVVRILDTGPVSGTFHMRWWGAGGFDIQLGDVNFAFDPYLFGEHLEKAQPIFDYIFISHEHFDHCHPETLKKLCRGPRFKKLFVSPGCLTPEQPIESYGLSAFARDLPIDQHIPREMIQVVYPKYLADPGEEFPGPSELDLGPIHVEVVDSGERARSDLPTAGYLVTHREKDVSFYHTGDLWDDFPEMSNLQDRVDFLIHCKIGLKDPGTMSAFLNYVQPRFFIPVHYRTDRTSDPVPYGHWPPNVTDVNAFVEDLRRQAGDRTTIVPFTAGVLYEVDLPSKQVNWKWAWKNTWDWDDVPWAP